jgi:phospholipid-binding lipoprotein MlaA
MLKALFSLLAFKIVFIASIASASAQSAENQVTKNKTPTSYYQNFDDSEFEDYEEMTIYDPMEKFNRKIFSFNEAFDRYFLEHIAKVYRAGVPQPMRNSIRNFLVNLTLPISACNSFLQGKLNNGLATLSNFLINSTIGVLGIFDVAGEKNIRYNLEDFGQTLGHYGVGSGAYIMLPILGPSSGRDFGGLVVDKSVSPLGFNLLEIGGSTDLVEQEYRYALTIASGIDTRESLIDIIDDIRKESFDPYATIRSAYLQKRAADVKE